MATQTTGGGSTTSFSNTPQAQDDTFTTGLTSGGTSVLLTEDNVLLSPLFFDVMGNDLGGAAKSLFSIDNGLNSAGQASPNDLLAQDTVRAEATSSDTSLRGAKIWITADGKVGYDASSIATAVNALSAGQILIDSFTYAIRLGNGTLSWATATVKITGTNDGPVAVADTNAVKEDTGPNPVSGNVLTNDTDLDVQDTHTVTAVNGSAGNVAHDVAGTYGTLHLNADGSYTYTLNNAQANVQALAEGQQVTDVFSYTNSDNHGGSSSSSLTIKITGSNDGPTITSGVQSGTVVEDAPATPDPSDSLNAVGTISFNDVDLSDGHTATFAAAPGNSTALGTFSLDPVSEAANAANGTVQWHYALNNAAAQYLAQGQSVTESYVVTVNDGHGGTVTQTVTVTINGTNDAPTITSGVQSGTVVEDAPATPDPSDSLNAAGTISFNDVDLGDGHTATFAAAPGNSTALGTFSLDPVSEAANAANGTVQWHYALNNAAAQYLAQGQSVTESYVVTVNDGHGGTVTQIVTVTIDGTNDAAIISGTSSGTVVEAGGVANAIGGTPTVSGTLTDSDVDNAANTFTVAAAGSATDHGYGTYEMTAAGTWTYTLNNSSGAVEALNVGDHLTDTFTVTTVDGTQQIVTVTIDGTNDAAIISGTSSGTVVEAGGVANAIGGTPTVSGTLTDSDVDNAANTFTVAAAGSATDHGYGTYEMTAAGTWTYTLNNSSGAVEALNVGDHLTDTFTVTTVDGTQQIVTVTIDGTNDAAIISGTSSGTVVEAGGVANAIGGTPTVSGTLTDSDVDNAANTFTVAAAGSATDHGYGTYEMTAAGTWTYTLNNSSGAVEALNVGDHLTDTFTVTTVDGTQQIVTVTIDGTNDAAIISGTSSGTVVEAGGVANAIGGTPTVSGTLTDSDVDNAANTFTVAAAGSATDHGYGTYEMTAAGTWTYTLNNSSGAVEALNVGDHLTDTFTVTTVDGTQQIVTVTIDGTNDAAIISGTSSGTVVEAGGVANAIGGTPTVSGTLTDSDVDNAANTFTVAAAGSATDHGYGTYEMTAAGTWTYTLNNSSGAVEALNVGDHLTDTFTVTTVDGTQQIVTVTIDGTNDAAIISGTSSGTVVEAGGVANAIGGTPTVSGTLTDSDVDNAANTFTVAAAGSATDHGYGTYEMTAAGTWTYTLNNSSGAVEALNVGDHLTDTFTVTTVDGTQQIVTVTIDGTNDAAIISGTSSGTVVEAGGVANAIGGTPTVSGTLTDSDVDNAANTFTVAAAGSATDHGYGTYEMTAAGTWTYTLNNSSGAVEALNVGDHLTDTFTVTTVDGTQQIVTVTIDGTNDAAIISGTSSGTVVEAGGVANAIGGTPTVSGTLTDSDVDNAANTFTVAAAGSATDHGYGTYEMTAAGTWTYTLNNSSGAVEALNVGDHLTDTFTVTTVDGTQQIVTVTIDGTNDAAIISGTSSGTVVEAGGVANAIGGTPTVSGTLTDSDVDNAANTFTVAAAGSATDHGYGTYEMTAAGTWTYTLNNSSGAVEALNVGDHLTDTFTVTTVDGTQQIVTVTIDGTNDAAIISGTSSGTVVEAGGVANAIGGTPTVSGTLTDSDVDNAANTFTVAAAGSATDHGYGTYEMTAAGTWTYTLNNSSGAVEALNVGDHLTDTFTVTTVDGTQQIVTVTIDGTNDAAIISGTSSGTVVEAGGVANAIGGTPTVSGTLTDSDVDNAANTFTVAAAGSATDHGYGTYEMTAAGTWTYTLNNSSGAVEALNVGDHLTDTFTVTTVDGTQQIVTVTIDGTNDAAIISGTSSGTVVEAGGVANAIGGTPTVSGTLTDSDVDNAANTFTVAAAGSATDHGYGTYEMTAAGTWTYTLNNSSGAVEALNVGDHLTDTFTVTTVDGTQQIVTVTIDGTNDAAIISGTSSGTVVEAGGVANAIGGTPTVSGTLTDSDVDNAANTFTVAAAGSATDHGYGTYEMTAAGTWTYTLNNSSGAVEALNVGDHLTDTFTVTTVDGTQQIVTVTIDGTNDAAIISGTSSGTVVEAGGVANAIGGTPTVSGTLTDSDVDNAANTFTVAAAGSATDHGYGTYEMTAAGTWTYTLNNSSGAVEALNVGDHLTDTFTVTTVDGTQQIVTVTIDGTNDAAIISGTSSGTVVEAGGVANAIGGTPTVSGTLTDSDVDNAANTFTVAAAGSATDHGYGTYEMTAAGTWTYTLNNSSGAVEALNVGDHLTDTFTVTTVDGTQQIVTVTIDGTNDAAIISGTSSGTVVEAGGVANAIGGTPTVSGTLTDSDVDNAANTFTVAAAGSATDHGYGTYEMTAAGTWTYTLNNSSGAVEALNVGDHLTDTFTVTTVDGTQQIVTVTIDGTNDAAIISGTSSGTVVEAGGVANAIGGTPTVSGTLTDSDVDNAANTFTVAAAGSATDHGYGTYEMTAAGTWTYTLNNSSGAVEALNVGDHLTDTFTVTTVDGTQQIVTVTIDGTNDAAIISGTSSGTVVEAGGVANAIGGTPTVSGTLTDSDVDNAANTFTVAAAGSATDHGYGTYEMTAAGTWTYTLNNSSGAVEALNVGDHLTDTFTVTTVDGTQQIVTVTIDGTNDAAIISGTSSGTVVEAGGVANAIGGTPTVSGTLTDSDVDNAANTFTVAAAGSATDHGYGTYEMTAAGTWTYTLNNSSGAVEALNVGDHLTDTFTVTTVDGTQQIVTVTIDGTNDAAIISGTSSGTVVEAGGVANAIGGTPTVSGTLTDSDVDNAANTFTVAAAGSATDHGYGTYEMTAAGTWTYTLNNSSGAVEALNVGDHLTDTFTVTTVDGTQQIVTVTIDGTNDAAIISGTSSGTVVEAGGVANAIGGTPTVSGTLTDSDVDNAANTFTVAAAGSATDHGYGTYEMTAAGTWTYTLNNSSGAVEALNVGDHLTDTFTVTTVDGTQQIVTVTIDGTNDAAIISGTSSGTVVEAGGVANAIGGTPTVSGTLTDSDVDNAANTFTVAAAGSATDHGYGTYEMTAAGTWTYTLNNSSGAVEALNVGDHLTDTFTVTTVDGTQQIVTVTIDGTNDAAIISGTSSGTVVEAGGVANAIGGTPTVSGTLTDSDVDNAANTFTVAAAGSATDHGYGTYEMTAAGTWTYTLNNSSGAVEALNVGDHLTDTFTVTTVDGTQQIVTVTIDGTNDAAIISGTSSGTVVEAGGVANAIGGTPTVSGTLTDSDVDNAANTFQVVTAGTASTDGYGTYAMTAAGVWTYTLNNSNAAVQALNTGGTLTDHITVATADGTTQLVAITINGSNDAAVISGTVTGSVTEAGGVANGTPGTPTATGTLTDTDVDNAANTFQVVTAGTASTDGYGTYAMTAAGVWTYTLNNSNAAVQALNIGGTLTDHITVATADGTTQLVAITINGSNDAAVISGTVTGSVTEAGGVANGTPGTPTATGTLTDTDVDNAANTFQVVTAGTASTDGYGTYAMTAAGVWTYTLNNSNAAVQALNIGGTLTDHITVATADGTTQLVTITINGSNDAPVANADTGTVNQDATLTVTTANGVIQGTTAGAVADTDVDNATNTLVVSGVVAGNGAVTQGVGVGSSLAGTYGHLTLNANGSYTYVADTADTLAAGITAVDTFTYTAKDPGGSVSNTTTLKITVTGINDAPVVTTQSPANLNVGSGVLVSSFRSSTDIDAGALHGIAITSLTSNGGGTWQYSTNGGSSWTNIGTVSATSALLLDDSNLVRITGSGNSGTLVYKAWDETTGTVGTKVNPGIGGGTTAFSSATNTLSASHPAGIAGEGINLGLTDPSSGHVIPVTITIADIQAGWTLSEGIDNGDGKWTAITNNVSSLFVTSPSNYTGALVLNVAETWTNADGSIGHALVVDNVEAYVPGNPIFALSGNDYLTGSSRHDMFVFSQPIGHDVIYSFDATSDQIDLVGYANFTGFSDIQAHIANDVAGNAVITLAEGQSITLNGVDAASLTASDFVFDQTPVTENAGQMVISDGAILPLSGTIDNTGTIELHSTGSGTVLELIEHGITLQGHGQVVLSDSDQNVITGTVSDVTLTNVDNTISGAGHLGDGVMVLVNEGTIIATGTNALDIDTGSNAVTNTGTLEATGIGGLEVHSDLINTGVLWANGGNVTIDGNVSGNGTAQISGSATLEFGAASSAHVALDAQATGTIVLHDSFDFSGVLSGFNGDDHLDLLDVALGAGTTASYVANQAGTGGTLSVTDGVHTANILLLGQYDPAGFQTEADKNTGTLISYHDHLV
ncbi:VCBS domain-containing protein [Bradyrhizobium lupini]|uniref:VCBS domain-containing protein n=1 Tax=Rhizobium lupini TaxID=136996 RepID=UPI00366D6C60